MIACPLCKVMNHHLATICASCGGFVQQKVDNLDLFQMCWRVLDSPQRAMKTVALARNKNYALVLSAFAGIGAMFALFWMFNVGEIADSFINIIAAGLATGPVAGIVFAGVLTSLIMFVSNLYHAKGSFRNIFAVLAYALTPINLSVMVVLPFELLTFGVYLFTKTPSAFALNPTPYVILLALDGLCVLWSVLLLMIGLKVLFASTLWKAIVISLASLIVFVGIIGIILSNTFPGY